MKDRFKKNKKIIVAALIIFLILLFIFTRKTDGMNNYGVYNISYRTRTIKSDYTNWARNGMPTKKLNNINNIDLKTSNKESGSIVYSVSGKNLEWTNYKKTSEKNQDRIIYGIRLNSTGLINKKYDVYYRTYNSKNKWMKWSSNGEANGNSKYPVQKIEIKIIPRNAISNEYLKDFNKEYLKKSSIGF